MRTIFLTVLIDNLKKKLQEVMTTLASQKKGYNRALSAAKYNLVDKCFDSIIALQSRKDEKGMHDELDLPDKVALEDIVSKLVKLNEAIFAKDNELNPNAKEPEISNTYAAILSIKEHTVTFFEKLPKPVSEESANGAEPKRLSLIDFVYEGSRPEHELILGCVEYIASEIFTPEAYNKEVWEQKVDAVFSVLQVLNERIRPEFSFEFRKKVTLEQLEKLKKDNIQIVGNDNSGTINAPIFSLGPLKLSIPLNFFGASEGRLKIKLDDYQLRIDEMSPPQSEQSAAQQGSSSSSMSK